MAWTYQSVNKANPVEYSVSKPITWNGSMSDYHGTPWEMYPSGCCDNGCSSCCANGLFCAMTFGTGFIIPPKFTLYVSEDGTTGVGADSFCCNYFPMSVIPCFNGCACGPFAFAKFVTPVKIEDIGDGKVKWTGTGSICAGGCCPCMSNIGDYGIWDATSDGSASDKGHVFHPVSMFWPPCVNGMCCGTNADGSRQNNFFLMQRGIGKPTKAAAPAGTEMARTTEEAEPIKVGAP